MQILRTVSSVVVSCALSAGIVGAAAQTIELHPFGPGRPQPDKPLLTTTANACKCQVADSGGNACMIFLRSHAADWIVRHAPQTNLRSAHDGRRYYDAPFALAASACAGRTLPSGQIKVHWLDRENAILEWK